MDIRKIRRESLKAVLRTMYRWTPLENPIDGWSIVLGTPWELRHLLEVNLLFVSRTDLAGMDRVHVVFDRVRQPGAEEFIASVHARFPDLPVEFHFHEPLPGRLAARIHQSKFYASMNWTTGLKACRTRWAVMHDFDLYPLDPSYFRRIVAAMRENEWRFSGAEITRYSKLTDADNLIGTWTLGIDVAWIRSNWSAVDCFHAVAEVNGRRADLDAFSYVQSRTPQRGLTPGLGVQSFAHVRNLCSTYLRFRKGEQPNVVWRLHFLWYLEDLCGHPENFDAALAAMRKSESPVLRVGTYDADFKGVHHTCSNVLRDEIALMENALHGDVRQRVKDYVAAFASFLDRHGDKRPVDELNRAWVEGKV